MAAKKRAKKVAKKAAKKMVKKAVVKKAAKKKIVKKAVKKAIKKAIVKKVVSTALPVLEKIQAGKKPFTRSEMLRVISKNTGITKQQASRALEVLGHIVHAHLKQGAPGILKIEGLMKIERVHKPAKKARKGVNPFTGQEMMFKAKPAHNIIKVRALKKLKEMV